MSEEISIDSVARSISKGFSELVDDLGKGKENNVVWWVSEIASRNPYTSTLFHDICRLVMKEKGHKRDIWFFLTPWLRYAKYAVVIFVRWLACRLISRNQCPLPEGCTIVTTFVFDNSFASGSYFDRYYNEFGGHVEKSEWEKFFFLPTYMNNLGNTFAMVRNMRKSSRHFLLKEDYLKLQDYLFAFSYPLRALFYFPRRTYLKGINVTSALRRTWYLHLASHASIEGLLRYRLATRLKERGVDIRLMVDWFENHPINRGLNFGIRRQYPRLPTVGYQGFVVSRHFLALSPTRKECEARCIPERVAVCGKSLVQERREYCSELNVSVAPAFRFFLAAGSGSAVRDNSFNILVTLPIMDKVSRSMVDMLLEAIPNCAGNTRFWLKPHPAMKNFEDFISKCGTEYSGLLTLAEGNIEPWLEKADVLISSASSSILEALVRGKPVILYYDRDELNESPIREFVSKEMWRLCSTAAELSSAINHYRGLDQSKKEEFRTEGMKVGELSFEPVTREATRKFLMLG